MVDPTQPAVVADIDGVLAEKSETKSYADRDVYDHFLSKLRTYRDDGFYIILYTARNMNTYDNNVGKINANTAPVLLDWLDEHDVPYDELHFGKPWPRTDGFYVDDNAIRPDEFMQHSHEELLDLLDHDHRKFRERR